MKRKVLVLFMVSTLLLCASCGTTYEEAEDINKNTNYGNGYFTVVTKWDDGGHVYRIVYANDTKVKYLIIRGGNQYGITPLYNADGSLQVYTDEIK